MLCKIQKIIPTIDLSTIVGNQHIHSIDDILDRDPLDTINEAFMVKHNTEMSKRQKDMLSELLKSINEETENEENTEKEDD